MKLRYLLELILDGEIVFLHVGRSRIHAYKEDIEFGGYGEDFLEKQVLYIVSGVDTEEECYIEIFLKED